MNTRANQTPHRLAVVLSLAFALGAATAVQAEVVDLGGATVSKSAAEFSDYEGDIIENGTINLTASPGNSTPGIYTIGTNATVTCSTEVQLSDEFTFNIVNGGTFHQMKPSSGDARFLVSFKGGNCTFNLDNGTFITDDGSNSSNAQALNFGIPWLNQSSVKDKDMSATVVMKNGSTISLPNGQLQIGGARNAGSYKPKTLKVDFTVTGSTISSPTKQIQLGVSNGGWLVEAGNSYAKAVFGPGSDITCKQIYAYANPSPSVTFNGATLHWIEGGNSFIGHAAGVGDMYTIDAGGLTVDIPSGKALTCDSNASSLKGAGGITKIGAGSITWNKVSSNGSPGMTFTGPLVVSNGTWTSTLAYAASAFKVDGANSTLALSGALTAANAAFAATDGGTLALAGAAITDTAPDLTLAGGGTTDYFTRDGTVNDYTVGALALGNDAALDLDGGSAGVDTISATTLALSATTDRKVNIGFSDAANVLGGTYNLITVTGGGTFANGDIAKFALDENLPDGSALSLSVDLTRLVLTVPVSNPATWTGGANDNNLLSPMNWLGEAVPDVDDDVVISVDSATELTCDGAFSVNSITFPVASAQVTVSGSGNMTIASEIVGAAASRPVIGIPVEFAANGEYKAIDVTGEVDFQGGVTGTVPANHTTFYGNYTLTAGTWTLSEAITLAANAIVTAGNTTIETSGTSLLNAEAGSSLTIKQLTLNVSGNIFGTFAGDLTVNKIYQYNHGGVTFNNGFSGVLRVNGIHHHSGSSVKNFAFTPASSATIIFGGGDCGIEMQRGSFQVNGCTFHSTGDWNFDNTDSNYSGEDGAGHIVIGANGIVVDTSDYDDPTAAGHTIAVYNTAKKSTNVLTGTGGVTATGNGVFYFKTTAHFTGGFTARDSVNVGVNAGVYPGNGNVTIMNSAVFRMRQSDSGTVMVSGTLSMAGGTTLRIPVLASGILPLSVNALAFDGVTAQRKVVLDINGGTLENGYYALVKSETALPAGAEEAFALDIDESVTLPAGATTSLVVQDNTLFLLVGTASDLPSGVWVGGVDDDMSNRFNWKNFAVPEAGSDLDFSGASAAVTVNADIDAAFGAVTMGTGVVTFTGSLTATSFSDTSKVAVGTDSKVTLDGDLEFTSGECYITSKVGDGGAFVVMGTIRVSDSADVRPYRETSSGWIVAKGLENAETSGDKWRFRLNNSNVAKWVVGEDGVSGEQYFWSFNNNNSDTTIKADADFTIETWLSAGTSSGKGVALDTSGWTDINANHTITANCGFIGVKPLTVKGGGTFLCNYTPTTINSQVAYSGAITVSDTATLAINAGKCPTTGAITVNNGAALEVAESGTVTLVGDLTLADGATLAFNYTKRAVPKLAIASGKTIAASGAVNVKISATAGVRPGSDRNVLTSGGGFSRENVTLAAGYPDWVDAIGVDEDGNIYIDVAPMGTCVIFR